MNYSKYNKEQLGKRIALARAKASLTQAGLAIIMGCNQSHVAAYEKGKRVPKDETLKRLSEHMKVDYNWLKYGDETFFDVEKTPFGKSVTINHFPGKGDTKIINQNLKKMNEDEVSIIQELSELIIREKDNKELSKYIKEREEKYQAQLNGTKITKKKRTPSVEAADELSSMYKYYPKVFMRLMKEEIELDEARKLTWFKEAQNYPELKKAYDKNPDDLNTQFHVIDAIIRIKKEKEK